MAAVLQAEGVAAVLQEAAVAGAAPTGADQPTIATDIMVAQATTEEVMAVDSPHS